MKKDKIIYWVSTGVISAMMLFSGYSYFTNPQIVEGFKHMGFPDFFRVELGIAKIIGALILLIPQIPTKIKEWAYAGFAFDFLFAAISHGAVDGINGQTFFPLVVLGVLAVSYIYYHKLIENKN